MSETREEHNARLLAAVRPETRRVAEMLLLDCESLGPRFSIWIGNALRTEEEQARLYAQGRTAPGMIVTRTLESRHITGEAFDVRFAGTTVAAMYPNDGKLWELVGRAGERAGAEWGGRWLHPDRPHFQVTARRPYAVSLAQWRARQ